MGWKFWESAPKETLPQFKASDEARYSVESELNKDEIEGFGPRSSAQRTLNAYKVMGERDMRRVISNIDDLQGIDQRYAKEFQNATLHMENRKAKESTLSHKVVSMVYEDLSKDKVYQHWQAEQEQLEKRINFHWVDKFIDRSYLLLTYSMRVWTTIGMCMGFGRTAYLWRSIDKRYAKIHGVSLPGIAMFEISLHTMKGAAAAFAATLGVAFGDNFPHLVYALYTGDPVYRSREWYNVTMAGGMWGFASCAAFAGMNYKYFGRGGMFKFTAAGTLLCTGVGYYVGWYIYKPFVETLEKRYDDPYWRPWQLRQRQRDPGARHQKGRFL